MITHYTDFKDDNGNAIPACHIPSNKQVTVVGAFENDGEVWEHLTRLQVPIFKLTNNIWAFYGKYEWEGSTAVKPGRIYDIHTNAISLPKGVYYLSGIGHVTKPQESGLSYHDGNFDLIFKKY